MFPLPLFYYFEIGALITSVVVLYRFNNKPLHWFIPFLFLIVCTEITGRYIRKELGEVNTWLYNISIPIEYIFYGFMIGSLCLTKTYKKVIFITSIIFVVGATINICFLQGFTTLNTNTLKAGSCIMIAFSGIGLIDLFKSDEHKTLLLNPLFWICTGVLLFNTGEFLYLFFFDSFLNNHWDKTANFFASINNRLIYILYTCIAIALVCTRSSQKKILVQ